MTKILRMLASYKSPPIFDIGEEYGPAELVNLPISRDLSLGIGAWDAIYQSTFNDDYPPDSAFPSVQEKEAHVAEGRRLAQALQVELGEGFIVEYRG